MKKGNEKSVFTGCFALRCKYFKQFLADLDLIRMEGEMINFEDELCNFLWKNDHIKIHFIETLNITANIFGEGKCQLTYW